MFTQIKNKIDRQLIAFVKDIDKNYSLSKFSPLLLKSIKDFVLRDGKRVRPILFVIGYLGFAKKPAPKLYTSALSIELLHDFMLVHDDIIDKSDTRRNKPSMHKMLNNYLKGFKKVKFNGQDLSIVVGDVMYALAIRAFLSIKVDMRRKEEGLKKLIEAALYTGSGEFLELVYSLKDIGKITKEDIYKVYDYKTACYTFACPLSTGAILAGVNKRQAELLFKYGLYLGRAFQIKDDILGMFSEEAKTGKSALTDLKEAKKTVLIWHAYNNSNRENKIKIKQILAKENAAIKDLLVMRKAIMEAKSLDYAKKEVAGLLRKSQDVLSLSRIKPRYKNILHHYAEQILTL